MSRSATAPEDFGREVLGPLVAEFCLRLWTLGAMTRRPDDLAMLFCARGGLRMQLAFECFLTATDLPRPVPVAPLMISRLVAIRPALARTAVERLDELPSAAASTLAYEFRHSSLAEVAVATAGVAPPSATGRWDVPFTPAGFAVLLRHPDAHDTVDALVVQASLFRRHLDESLGRRRHAMLVDTGLYGTTRQVLADGCPDLEFSSALIARSYRPGLVTRNSRTFGLSVESDGYSPLRRRTALLRYWHFVEWLFEPPLSSVRTFVESRGEVRSNLETPDWQDRIGPVPGTAFAGVIDYLDRLPAGAATQVTIDADRAWGEFRRAVVWPDSGQVEALSVGTRSHDFGVDGTWSARPWNGPVAALRGSSMWREGEIAESASVLRRPLLAAVEAAHGARRIKRSVMGRRRAPSA